MKKNLIYLLIFLILLSVAGWLLTENNERTTLEGAANYSFTISDTASVSKIIISSKKPEKVELIRSEKGWLVNGEFPARDDAMSILLTTLKRMELRNFVPVRMQETVMKNISALGKKVEIYQNGKLAKTIYVGTPTMDEMGTYMMIKDADAPYAVHIPGFNGFLDTRFFTDPYLWRSRQLFDIVPRNIKEVKMTYPDSLAQSFRIRVFSPDSIYLVKATDNEVVKDINITKAKLYLAAIKNLSYEGAITPSDPIYNRRDSLLSSTPIFRMEVKDIDGKLTTVSGYRIKGERQVIDENDPSTFYDPDRMHGFINGNRMVLLQYYGLSNALKSLAYFRDESE